MSPAAGASARLCRQKQGQGQFRRRMERLADFLESAIGRVEQRRPRRKRAKIPWHWVPARAPAETVEVFGSPAVTIGGAGADRVRGLDDKHASFGENALKRLRLRAVGGGSIPRVEHRTARLEGRAAGESTGTPALANPVHADTNR